MNDYDLWFSMVNLNSKVKFDLIRKFKSSKKLWYYSINEKRKNIFNDKVYDKLVSAWNLDAISRLKEKLYENTINFITYEDKLYPENLKRYEYRPYSLFYKGEIKNLNFAYNIAIVGSRRCTSYGINATQVIVKDLCKNNINIISGMARGIDTIAHKNSLKNNGYTCAVLGSGIDVVYPRENRRLYEELCENGCVISEFVPGTEPYAYNFPIRNRIISALSNLIIVVEAGEKSGSLITASLALEQGKDIIAVPGTIFSSESKGTNKLIKDGAYPLTNLEDIYSILGIDYTKNEMILNNKKDSSRDILSNIIQDTPIHMDDIIKNANIDIQQIYTVLFEMQLRDEIMCLSGNFYVRVKNEF